MKRPNLGLSQRLLLTALVPSLLLAMGLGAAVYSTAVQSGLAEREQRLEANLKAGVAGVRDYMSRLAEDADNLASRKDLLAEIGIRAPRGWTAMADARGYEDLLVFDAADRLVYSAKKHADLGVDFSKGSGDPLSEGALGILLTTVAGPKGGSAAFADFHFYKPAGKAVAFMAAPIVDSGVRTGTVVIEIAGVDPGTIAETHSDIAVVGSDGLMRSQSRLSNDPNVLITPFRADFAVDAKADGRSKGTLTYFGQPTVGAAAPVEIAGAKWTVIAVEPEGEAFAFANDLLNIMLLTGCLLLALAAFVGWMLSRSVTRPITSLTDAMKSLAEGNLATDVESTSRVDEIGEMARTVEVFRANALKLSKMTSEERALSEARRFERAQMLQSLQMAFGEVVDAAQRGDFSQRVEAKFSDQELNAIALSINNLVETVDRGLGETGQVLAALAQTDLTHRVKGMYEGAFKRLKMDTNAVAERLTEIVGHLKGTSQTLKTATHEILSGANDLSERTTKQAATIEETSATMEQLAVTVQQNAQRAKDANEVAASVTRTAEEGGLVMSQATAAMERITASSGKISNIIGLIDDIAFQTNLLALNASVEAARAGETGKGFAVVAIEVRRLAQSAAKASAEVKGLIEQSSLEVKSGSRLVGEAALKLGVMLGSARRSNELMDGIARDSQEQASSIEEVSTAVRLMDEMTQHNAALVEQTNASIEQAEAQATELDGIVDLFTVDERAPLGASSVPLRKGRAPGTPEPASPGEAESSRGIKGLQERVRRAAKAYISPGATAPDKDWEEF